MFNVISIRLKGASLKLITFNKLGKLETHMIILKGLE